MADERSTARIPQAQEQVLKETSFLNHAQLLCQKRMENLSTL